MHKIFGRLKKLLIQLWTRLSVLYSRWKKLI